MTGEELVRGGQGGERERRDEGSEKDEGEGKQVSDHRKADLWELQSVRVLGREL